MSIRLGENIKKLRKNCDISQEMLASRLGVTFQAVSKWERGESYPDITMLPALANFFGVTVDELLGTAEDIEEKEVEAILIKLQEYEWHHDGDGMRAEIDKGLKKYPGNFWLMAWDVYAYQRINPTRAIESGIYVLDNCTDNRIRSFVNSNIAYAYKNNGDIDKAIELAKQLPSYYETSQDTLRNFLTGEEQLTHVQHLIKDLAYEFWYSVRQIRHNYTPEEQIELFEKSNKLYDAIYETDDVPFKLTRKMRNFQGMAEVSLMDGEIDKGLEYMDKAVQCAELHDSLPKVVEMKSILYNAHTYDRQWEYAYSNSAELLSDFETEDEFYKNVRLMDKYKALVKRLIDAKNLT